MCLDASPRNQGIPRLESGRRLSCRRGRRLKCGGMRTRNALSAQGHQYAGTTLRATHRHQHSASVGSLYSSRLQAAPSLLPLTHTYLLTLARAGSCRTTHTHTHTPPTPVVCLSLGGTAPSIVVVISDAHTRSSHLLPALQGLRHASMQRPPWLFLCFTPRTTRRGS